MTDDRFDFDVTTTCGYCGVGCRLEAHAVGGRVASGPADRFAVEVLTPELLGHPSQRRAETPDAAATDLAHLVTGTTQAAGLIGVGTAHRPWLPPLPDLVPLDQLAAPETAWHVPYAAVDRPDDQSQQTLTWDLAQDTHLAIAGTLRSGRSTALRTIAASIAARFTPAQVHLHAVDGGSGGLSALTCLPRPTACGCSTAWPRRSSDAGRRWAARGSGRSRSSMPTSRRPTICPTSSSWWTDGKALRRNGSPSTTADRSISCTTCSGTVPRSGSR